MPGGSEWGSLPRICSSTGVGPVGSCRPDGKSRVTGDCHARFCGSPGVRFPRGDPTRGLLRPGVSVSARYEFIDVEKATCDEHGRPRYAIVKMCQWLEVSTSGFYEWLSRPSSATAKRREYLVQLIEKAFADSDETYGYRRVHAQLLRWGEACTAELVRALMRLLGLVACQPRPWRPSLTEQGPSGPIPDLVGRDFAADAPGTKMVGDITYIATWEGWLFLATVLDCHTKAVVGWAMDDNYKTPLISAAIEMAARNHSVAPKAIFHSDRGSNYTSVDFAATLARLDAPVRGSDRDLL